MVSDVNRLGKAKFGIGILPANDSIKATSKRIKKNDVIKVSGMYFKLKKVFKNNKEQQITRCLANIAVFYATKLEIEKN